MSELHVAIDTAKARLDELCRDLPRIAEIPQIKPRRGKKSHRRRVKRKELLAIAKTIGADLGKRCPCVGALVARIMAGESIGFAGRKKVVGELILLGTPEDSICRIFLESSAFSEKYEGRLIVRDTRPQSNPCGWRLSPSWRTDYEPSCVDVQEFCRLEQCYRSELILPPPKNPAPTFAEFQRIGAEQLQQVFND